MTTIYDQVRYPNWPVARSHPAHTGAMARLLGRKVAPFSRCRVLEIACSEGVNIANLATCAPESEFVGVDVAESVIARGAAIAADAGLDNIRLKARDIRDAAKRYWRRCVTIRSGWKTRSGTCSRSNWTGRGR